MRKTLQFSILILWAAYSLAQVSNPKVRGRFNYSSRPLPTLSQSPINNRVPDFSLIDENDEEPSTKSPIDQSISHEFSIVGTGFDKKSEGHASKPVRIENSEKSPVEIEEEDNSNEEEGRRRSLIHISSKKSRNDDKPVPVLEDDEITTKPPPPIPPIGYEFFHVSNELNRPKVVDPQVEDNQNNEVEKKKKEKETDKVENSEEEDENDNSEEKKVEEEQSEHVDVPFDVEFRSRVGRLRKNTKFSNLRQAVPCGYHRMRNGNVISFQSSNFNFSEYRNNELCSWRFFGHHCILRVSCPCFDIPPSSNCKEDHLKITDGYGFALKFCGRLQPSGSYKSTTNNLMTWFKTDGRDTANGFLCYVTCTGPGQAEPTVPFVICPEGSTNSATLPPGEVTIPPVFSTSSSTGTTPDFTGEEVSIGAVATSPAVQFQNLET